MSLVLGKRNEPQPDFVLLAPRAYEAPHAPPSPADVYAVIELSDSSLRKDLGTKLRVYARHEIADYLVVDLSADVLLHHRQPHELGYHVCDRLARGDTFAIGALSGVRLRAEAFLAPEA
jgi:Uma2 family endonuclease